MKAKLYQVHSETSVTKESAHKNTERALSSTLTHFIVLRKFHANVIPTPARSD